jgi:hypothetical protein
MGTSHVGQMGCWLFEDVSATRHCQRTSDSVALLTILMCGQRHGPAFVPPFECDRRFHTGKSGSAASFQRQRWLSISARRHNEGKDPDRCHSVARRTPLIGRRVRQQFGSNQMGRKLPAWAKVWFQRFRCPLWVISGHFEKCAGSTTCANTIGTVRVARSNGATVILPEVKISALRFPAIPPF